MRIGLESPLWLACSLTLAAMLVSAAETPERSGTQRASFYVFGTLVEVELRDVSERKGQDALAEIGGLFATLHSDWHAWRGGALGDVNAAIAQGQEAAVNPVLSDVLILGKRLACQSGGLFDPAIGGLIGLWGFHDDVPPEGAPPNPEAITRWTAAAPVMQDLTIRDGIVQSRNPAVQLDLGAYAKGAALDLAEEVLARHGIANAVLNAGGDVNVTGRHDARPWRVAIRDPFVWDALGGVELASGEVLYTSGNYERYFDHAGTRFAHILDPRTGWPVQDVVSVSVLGTGGAKADAAATAISVAGLADWAQVAADMGQEAVLIIAGDGRMQASPAMADRLFGLDADAQAALTVVPLPPASVTGCDAL